MRNWQKKTRGFTLLELVIVLGVILVLGGLVLVGVNQLSRTSKTRATAVTLQNLAAMRDAWEKAAKTKAVLPTEPLSPATISWTDGSVTADGKDRAGVAVQLVHAVMSRIGGLAENKNVLGKLPTESLWASFPVAAAAPWGLGNHVIGERVSKPGRVFVCIASHTSSGTDEPLVGANAYKHWAEQIGTIPVVLDPWSNPIIYVPACGIQVQVGKQPVNVTSAGVITPVPVKWSSAPTYGVGQYVYDDGGTGKFQLFKCTATNSNQQPPDTSCWAPMPVKGFFASAGEDGNFLQGDDNLYSFEN